MSKMNKAVSLVLMMLSLVWVQNPGYAKDYVGGNFQLKDSLDTTDFYCFDLFGFGVNLEMSEIISARTCKNPGWPDTTFRVDYPEQGQIYAIDLDLCVEATNFARGAHIRMQACSETTLQRFNYAEDQTVRLRSEDNSRELCLVVNPSAGVPMDGAGKHLRREVFLYECGRSELKHAQWIIPEGSEYSPAMVAKDELVPAAISSGLPGASEYVGACSRCHGANAEGIEGMQAPRLAGMPAAYVKAQFYQFYNGIRGSNEDGRWAAQMTYYVQALSERHLSAIDDIVAYIADLPEPEITPTIHADDNQVGNQIYDQQCAACHGIDGLGNVALKSPRIAGLQDWYLLRQMEKYRGGRRGGLREDSVGKQMVASAKALSEEHIQNVIAYINQL